MKIFKPLPLNAIKECHNAEIRPSMAHPPYRLHLGDSLDILQAVPNNTYDSVVTDPPYGLSRFDAVAAKRLIEFWVSGKPMKERKGVQGATWDGEVPHPNLWKEIHRVLKPGAHAVAFTDGSTSHLTTLGMQLGGFEILHKIAWIHNSRQNKMRDLGTPVHNAAKKARNDNTPDKVISVETVRNRSGDKGKKINRHLKYYKEKTVYEITSPEGLKWAGWRTHLTRANDEIIIARKRKSEPNVAANLLRHGVGAMNVKGCADPDTGHLASTILMRPEGEIRAVNCPVAGTEAHAFLPEGMRNHHPCAKPIDLMLWLTRLVTPPGGLVLNPFSGSGSGGIAAIFGGFPYVGIERDPVYAEIGRQRIEGALKEFTASAQIAGAPAASNGDDPSEQAA
jgi:site-specific DNA-methyltransferase (adenine-specific)